MQPIPLPPFALLLWLAALGTFVVCAFLLTLWRGRAGSTTIAAALTPFVIPVGVTAFTVLVVSGIGIVLLTVGKSLAVPLALLMALLVLLGASYLSARPSGASGNPT